MNLFRPEHHARNWNEWNEELCWTLHPVVWWVETFGMSIFRNRARPDFMTLLAGEEGAEAMTQLRARVSG
ncbi:MAG: hypothetical protein P8J75_12810 [Actinomycetota bacterium]|nr:hypothetical protein [Actinomycetota bacterium]